VRHRLSATVRTLFSVGYSPSVLSDTAWALCYSCTEAVQERPVTVVVADTNQGLKIRLLDFKTLKTRIAEIWAFALSIFLLNSHFVIL